MSKKLLTILYIVLAVLAICKATNVVEGYFLSPGWLGACLALPLAALSLLYLIIRAVWAIPTRRDYSESEPRFWSPLAAVALLLLLWGMPTMPGYLTRLFGYYLRVQTIGDVPAILAWADRYATSTTAPSTEPADGQGRIMTGQERIMMGEWETVPYSDMPSAVKRMGSRVEFRRRDRAVMVGNGGGLTGHWGLTVGRGIGQDGGGTRWAIDQDGYVWDSE